MKIKTSVSLSEDILREVDERIGSAGNRSEFLEEAVRIRLRDIRRAERNAKDAAIYARMAADPEMQREAEENLKFSVPWSELGDDVEVSDEVEARWAREEREGTLEAG